MFCCRIIRKCCDDLKKDEDPDEEVGGGNGGSPGTPPVDPNRPDEIPNTPEEPKPPPSPHSSDIDSDMDDPSDVGTVMPIPPFHPGDGGGISAHTGPRKRLISGTQHLLTITSDKNVIGVEHDPDSPDPDAELDIRSTTSIGEVRIKGVKSGAFIAMDDKGNVYAQDDPNSEDIIFYESYNPTTNSSLYVSKKQYLRTGQEWFLAIKRNGKLKKGPKTTERGRSAKSAQFLPLRPLVLI